MCTLTNKSSLTSVEVYKVVFRYRGLYISPFAGMTVQTGDVYKMKFIEDPDRAEYNDDKDVPLRLFDKCGQNWLTDEEYRHKISGFQDFKHAKILLNDYHPDYATILKLTITKNIWEGEGAKISDCLMDTDEEVVIYAGEFVQSLEEVF